MKLSIVIIAKNAEVQIREAIESVKFADEVLVVDGGSTDNTVGLAEKLGARIVSFSSANFSDVRNFGLENAKGEWIFYLDTDERVTRELARNIKYHISNTTDKNIETYKIKRKNFYFGNYQWPYIEKLVRLFKRSALHGWQGELHESPRVEGVVGELDGFLLHYTHRDLNSMLAKTIEWSKTEAQLRLQTDHPKMVWWRFFRVMATAFFDSYVKQGGWKAGVVGLIESIYQVFSMFVTYVRLWELQQYKAKKI